MPEISPIGNGGAPRSQSMATGPGSGISYPETFGQTISHSNSKNTKSNGLEGWTIYTGKDDTSKTDYVTQSPPPYSELAYTIPPTHVILSTVPQEEYRTENQLELSTPSTTAHQGNCPNCGIGDLEIQTCTTGDLIMTVLCCLIFLPLGALCIHTRCNTEYKCSHCKARFDND